MEEIFENLFKKPLSQKEFIYELGPILALGASTSLLAR
jgi:hypothetical protein